MRLVLDTNIVLSALLWRGTPHRLLGIGLEQDVAFFTSSPLLDELTGILERPRFARALRIINYTIDDVIDRYLGFVHVVKTMPLAQPVSRDPDDDLVLACAAAAQAELIITGDRDLLVLKEFQNIPIVTAVQALSRLEPR